MRQKLIFFLVIVGVSSAAYFFGVEAASFLNSMRTETKKKENLKFRDLTLDKMQTIQIGERLPNHLFYELNGNMLELQKIRLQEVSIFTYATTECHFCDEQFEILSGFSADSTLMSRIWIVSPSNPFELFKLNKRFNNRFKILYDHDSQFCDNLKIMTFPFHIIVESDFVIKDIVVGQMGTNEIKEILK